MSDNGAAKGSSPPSDTEPPAATPRRGRGRPRKPQQEPTDPPTPKRPRGRPRGSKNKGPRAVTKKAEPVGEKRPRGRPRKWPRKVAQEEGGQAEAEEAMEGPSEAPPSEEGE